LLGYSGHCSGEVVPLAWKIFTSLHISVGICGTSFGIKVLWYRTCGEKLGWSEADKDGAEVTSEWRLTAEKAYYLYFINDRAGKSSTQKVEKIDAARQDAMFGDEDIAFDYLKLENFGVDTTALRQSVVQHIFRAYVEDCEQEAQKNNDDCVAEVWLLSKYRGLVFVDPDTGKTFSAYDRYMEFRRSRGNGWFVLVVSLEQDTDDNNNEYEAFSLEVACKVIKDTPQSDEIIVVWEG
jgi:hypothetical protein